MNHLNRRAFLKQAGLAGAAALVTPPTILAAPRVRRRTAQGRLLFQPAYVQRGQGPHMDATYVYASDTKWDTFPSDIAGTQEGLQISDTEGQERFGINIRWNVEGFGYLFLTADNGGDFYALPPAGKTQTLNLNYELAKSRIARNRRRAAQHRGAGWQPSREAQGYLDLSEGYLEDAERAGGEEARGAYAQKALQYALWGSELMELDYARQVIQRQGYRPGFFMGCDARSFYHMDPDTFLDRFTEIYDYATITHYLEDGLHGMPDFEPTRDGENFDTREAMLERLRARGVAVEGRPLFWPHKLVTPNWLREMTYDDLKRYVERHTREVVGHYGDRMYAWEIVNEFHDWANEVQVTPEQAVELTKLACDVARAEAPGVHRLINNCCPYAEYVQMRQHSSGPAQYPQRTPWEFMRDLTDAGVDFTVTGQQMYFPYRDLQDTILLIERFETFGRPVQLTEVGASSGPSDRSVKLGTVPFPDEPYVWRRPWDEALQADWLEGLYTLAYSKPWIEAVNWYDFMDGQDWIDNGGMIRGPEGERKAAFHRLKALQDEWKALPQRS